MELKDMFSNFKNINGVANAGVYQPPNARAIQSPYITRSFVHPWLGKNNMWLGPEGDQMRSLETLFHEQAHTVQPIGMLDRLFNNQYSRIDKVPFNDYDEKDRFPNSNEKLATLRAKEAMLKKGQTIWDDDMGKQFLKDFLIKNPDMDINAAKRHLDRLLMPEHSVMHEWKP